MRNHNHYPSQDRIEKLKSIGFPFSGNPEDVQVMEMLDVMPKYIRDGDIEYELTIRCSNNSYTVMYYDFGYEVCCESFDCDNLADALGHTIIWLHENKHLTFQNGN